MLIFARKSDTCWVAFGRRPPRPVRSHVSDDEPSGQIESLVAIRLILDDSGWRVDFCDSIAGSWLPWEPALRGTYDHAGLAANAANLWAEAKRIEGEI